MSRYRFIEAQRDDHLVRLLCQVIWAHLRTGVLEGRERPVFADLADAQRRVADYFDYYKHERRHASIDYQTPYHIHQQLLQLSALSCPG